MAVITLRRPVVGVVTSGYGQRGSSFHHGMDIANRTGTPIFASAAGVVTRAGWNGGYGNYVAISHGKTSSGELSTTYGHMSAIKVVSGQRVAAGTVIGHVGSTGDSTGPHLHWEIRLNGKSTNPASAVNKSYTVAQGTGGTTPPAVTPKPTDPPASSTVDDITKFAAFITSPESWKRLALYGLGFGLLMLGLGILVMNTTAGSNTAAQVKREVVKQIKQTRSTP